jgi:hypothetical protein
VTALSLTPVPSDGTFQAACGLAQTETGGKA